MATPGCVVTKGLCPSEATRIKGGVMRLRPPHHRQALRRQGRLAGQQSYFETQTPGPLGGYCVHLPAMGTAFRFVS